MQVTGQFNIDTKTGEIRLYLPSLTDSYVTVTDRNVRFFVYKMLADRIVEIHKTASAEPEEI